MSTKVSVPEAKIYVWGYLMNECSQDQAVRFAGKRMLELLAFEIKKRGCEDLVQAALNAGQRLTILEDAQVRQFLQWSFVYYALSNPELAERVVSLQEQQIQAEALKKEVFLNADFRDAVQAQKDEWNEGGAPSIVIVLEPERELAGFTDYATFKHGYCQRFKKGDVLVVDLTSTDPWTNLDVVGNMLELDLAGWTRYLNRVDMKKKGII